MVTKVIGEDKLCLTLYTIEGVVRKTTTNKKTKTLMFIICGGNLLLYSKLKTLYIIF